MGGPSRDKPDMYALLVTLVVHANTPTPHPAPAAAVNECERFNREEEARRANHKGRCPYCPCACGRGGIVCAPCAACEAFGPDPTEGLEAQVPPKKYRISGRVVSVSRICGGGAAITPEMEANLPPPQPLVGKVLLVVAGQTISAGRVTARITSGANGKFETQLESGTWCLFDASRKLDKNAEASSSTPSPAASPDVDAVCLAQERRRCDEIVRVKDGDRSNVQVGFYASCPQVYNQPCYRGPMPP